MANPSKTSRAVKAAPKKKPAAAKASLKKKPEESKSAPDAGNTLELNNPRKSQEDAVRENLAAQAEG